MPRYFLEVAYKGSNYSGFQKQDNANSVQAEVEKAFSILQRADVELTGSSRTDTGVHARQNFFHFDFDGEIHPQFVYKMNAILPGDIVVKGIYQKAHDAHCRFDATGRLYRYYIYRKKDPFRDDRAYYFPYKVDEEAMKEAAAVLMEYDDFSSFSKRHTQVKTNICRISRSEWTFGEEETVYEVEGDRFLRGMVRGMVGTMLLVGRGKLSVAEFRTVIEAKDAARANFAVPGKGLFLERVVFGEKI